MLTKPSFSLPVRFRQSSLEDAKCLWLWRAKHILDAKETDTEASRRGTGFHDAADEYVKHLVLTRQSTDYIEVDRIAQRYPGDGGSLFVDWSKRQIIDFEKVVGTEWDLLLSWDFATCLTPEIASVDEYPISARLDLVMLEDAATVIIRDYKTHYGIYSPDRSIQSRFYPWILSKYMPYVKRFVFQLEFVRYNVRREVVFGWDEIRETESEIIGRVNEILEAIETNTFPARVCDRCSYCKLDCPLVGKGLSRECIGQVGNPDRARDMAEEAYALQRRAEAIMTALRNWTVAHGPIELTDHVLESHNHDAWKYPPQQIVRLNRQHGLDEFANLQPDHRALKKIFRSYPDYETALKATGKNPGRSEFSFRKIKENDEDEDKDSETE